MIDIDTAMVSIKTGISLLTETIGLVQKTKEILPDSDDKEAIEKSLNEALKATQIAEAQIADALGYNLCKCTFPPQVMLSQGYKLANYSHVEEFICPSCGKSSVPPTDPPINIKQSPRYSR